MASLAEQFQQRIGKAIGTRAKDKVLEIMYDSAVEMVHEFTNTREFYDVTGNLLNSFAVGIYYRGKLVNIVDADTIGRKPPTRRSLSKGERYDLDKYYSGDPVRHKTPNGGTARPYVGEYGHGGQDGVSAARRSLAQRHPEKMFALVGVVAMQYAEFVQNKKGHDVLTKLRDEMPYIFEGKIVAI